MSPTGEVRVPTLKIGAILQGLLMLFVAFLAGWVWNMERRVTTIEVQKDEIVRRLDEIGDGVKELRTILLTGENHP